MLKLPKIPYTMDKDKQQVVSMGNINYSKMTRDGDIADSSGISGRHFPYITTAKECAEQDLGENIVSATFFRGKWVTVDEEGILRYGGEVIDPLEKGEKQFAAINTKLVIMPDKKYLDVSEGAELKDLGAEAVFYARCGLGSVSASSGNSEIVGGGFNDNTFSFKKADEGVRDCYGIISRYNDGGSLKLLELIASARVTLSYGKKEFSVSEWEMISIPLQGDAIYISSVSSGLGEWNSISSIQYISGSYRIVLNKACTIDDVSESEATPLSIYKEIPDYIPEDYHEHESIKINDLCVYYSPYVYDGVRLVHLDLADGDRLPIDIPFYIERIYNGGLLGFLMTGQEINISFEYMEQSFEVSGTIIDVKESSIITDGFTEISGKELPVWTEGKLVITSEGSEFTLNTKFKSGDVVALSEYASNNNSVSIVIDRISEGGTTIFSSSLNSWSLAGSSTTVKLERRIPDMDYICEYGNRLYGCSNADQTIYVSALGDPTNIYAYEGVSTDSYAVAVASEGNFTGCCPYDGGVMFWKEQKLHKLLGSYPAEYALYTYNIDGVQEGSHKSLQNIGEVLFYKGERGVFAFDGSPRLISENFGEKRFTDAVAGNDGECYYISMKDKEEKQHFFSYNTRTGLWVREGDMAVSEFIRAADGMHILGDGKIYLYGAEETNKDSEWFVQFAPIYETVEGKKSYSRIKMRIELPQGSHMVVSVRCDGGRWAECGKIVGRVAGVVPVMVPINRCDKFELKIDGKGPCVIHSILREYYVGSDR